MVYPTLSLRRVGMGVLVFGAVVMSWAVLRAEHGTAEFVALRESVALAGGGVVFVRNAEDCSATAGPVEYVAARLDSLGVDVRGVVLRRGPVDIAVQVASRAFPHEPLSPLATMPLVHLGYLQTPLAMVVDAAGVVVRVEPVATRSPAAVARSLASHLGRP